MLAGITSWGSAPIGSPNNPSAFTRVTSYLDWIVPGPATSVDGGPYQPVTATLQTATTYTRTGLTNGNTHRYAVRYYNDVNLGTTLAATGRTTT